MKRHITSAAMASILTTLVIFLFFDTRDRRLAGDNKYLRSELEWVKVDSRVKLLLSEQNALVNEFNQSGSDKDRIESELKELQRQIESADQARHMLKYQRQ